MYITYMIFLKLEEKNKLTGAQKGTLIHLCMQNLDEKVDYNLIKVKELINSLVEKQIITKIEGEFNGNIKNRI